MVLTPGDELAQVEGVGVAGRAPVAGQEAGQCQSFPTPEGGI